MLDRRTVGLFLIIICALGVARAQGRKPTAASLWPANTPHEWSYSGRLRADGADNEVHYTVRTRDKETIDGRAVHGLETVSTKGRVIATEWYAFDGENVLLVRQQSGDQPPRTLDPPQTFLAGDQLDPGKGKWQWSSKDGTERVEAHCLATEPLSAGDGVARTCVVVKMTLELRDKATDAKPSHVQARKLWLAPDVGLVREISTTSTAADGGPLETETDVTLSKVATKDK